MYEILTAQTLFTSTSHSCHDFVKDGLGLYEVFVFPNIESFASYLPLSLSISVSMSPSGG